MLNWFRLFTTPGADPMPGDPFSDPRISAMSLRDLADLPLTPPPAPAPTDVSERQAAAKGRTIVKDPIRAAMC